jgi:hypothetical protein
VNLDTSDEDAVGEFVKDLGEAITKDMAEIRETELSRTGGYQRFFLEFDVSRHNITTEVFVDKLGRLVVPAGAPWNMLAWATDARGNRRKVVKREERHSGTRVTSLAVYLESEESDVGEDQVSVHEGDDGG